MSDRLSRSEPRARPELPQELQSIALPPAAALPQSLSRELQKLLINRCVFIDSNGTLVGNDDKSVFVDQNRSPLVSFRKESNGSVRVYAGLPPRNATHCDSGPIPNTNEIFERPNIHGPVILNSGDWLALTHECPVAIPTTKNPAPKDAAEKLTEILASAQVGDTLILGRHIEESCAKIVSRYHITVKVLERTEVSQTHFDMRVLAIPGIAGTHPIFEVKSDGTLDQIIGSKNLRPGSTIQVGDNGERFTIPHPPGSQEEGSVMFHRSILLGDKEAHHSMLSLHGEVGLQKARIDALKHFVLEGVSLIRDGRPLEALEHLKKESKELEAAGYILSVNTVSYLDQITPEAIAKNLYHVAHASRPGLRAREITPGLGALNEDVKASNEHEEQLLQVWQKNLALIFAGEYVRALQEMNRGGISDYAPLFGGKNEIDPAADTALVFLRQGIDLSDGHFVNLYKGQREAALAVANGSQTAEEELSFRAAVLAAPLKTPVPIHDAIRVARTESGYVVTPTSRETRAFIMRLTGPATRLLQLEILQGGDTLYIGSRRFILPTISSDASEAKKS